MSEVVKENYELRDLVTKLQAENNEYEWALDWFSEKHPADYEVMLFEQSEALQGQKGQNDGN